MLHYAAKQFQKDVKSISLSTSIHKETDRSSFQKDVKSISLSTTFPDSDFDE